MAVAEVYRSVSQGSDFALVTLSTVSRYVVVAALDLTKQVRDARTGLRWTHHAVAARTRYALRGYHVANWLCTRPGIARREFPKMDIKTQAV